MTSIAAAALLEPEAADYRSRFPIFDHTIYLNSCSLGPLSRDTAAALDQYRYDWSRYGAPVWWKSWLDQLSLAKERFASLIGARPHEISISHSVSSALSTIASTFDYARRSKVVCTDLDFPTIPYQWLARRKNGVDVRFARSDDRVRVTLDAYREHIDDKVALVATSHTFYTTGYIQPIRAIADLMHERGGRIVVDGYHSVGVHPVDVKALDVDFYVGGTLKWLLGGPGLTFIYVREELIADLEPSVTGWFAAADQFAFDSTHLQWQDTASRLELGTPSVATAYTGIAGMDIICEAGPERIYARVQGLTDEVVRRARRAGYAVLSPENRTERAGIVMLGVEQPEKSVQDLSNLGFTVDYRPGLVRVSPHFYNTVDDVRQFMDALETVQSVLR
ncbi:MAG: aminotransferase class V-fold PLP-dependent enzyme [Chloroflexota bacterium]